MKNYLIIAFTVLSFNVSLFNGFAQTKELDSLNTLLKKAQHDSTKVKLKKIIGEVGWILRIGYWDTIATEANKWGLVYDESDALNNLGYIYDNQGKKQKALEYYFKTLKIKERINDTIGIALALNNIGLLYKSIDEIDDAIKYYNKSIELYEAINDYNGASMSLNNIGVIYDNIKHDYDSALTYYEKSLNYKELANDIYGKAFLLNNIGMIFNMRDQFDTAMYYYQLSYDICIKNNFKNILPYPLIRMGNLYYHKKEYNTALKYALEAYELVKNQNQIHTQQLTAELLYLVYKEEKNWQKALEIYEWNIQLKDSVKNQEVQKAAIRQQTKYEFEKEQLLEEQKLKEETRKLKEETERRNNLQYSIIFIVILVVFGFVLSLGVIKTSSKFAEGLIFFAFLIFFEFCLVLLDPFINKLSNGEPVYTLLLNALMAVLIFPLHAFFEAFLKKKIISHQHS